MDAYIELLKASYYKERKNLEEMSMFEQGGKLRFLVLRKEILEKARDSLSLSEMLGRKDIAEEIKDNLLHDRDKAEKVEDYLAKTIENEMSDIQKEEEAELRNAGYSPDDYAQYLLQLEKVNALESELENNRLMSDMVYEEQKAIHEGKKVETN
jgi:hypothetical protein